MDKGYYFSVLSQALEEITVDYSTRTFFEALTIVGGQAVSIMAICNFFLQHYQSFAYDKSTIKRLYNEEASQEKQEEEASKELDDKNED